jgi:hypothetical protein
MYMNKQTNNQLYFDSISRQLRLQVTKGHKWHFSTLEMFCKIINGLLKIKIYAIYTMPMRTGGIVTWI